jgi:hypothetical protein
MDNRRMAAHETRLHSPSIPSEAAAKHMVHLNAQPLQDNSLNTPDNKSATVPHHVFTSYGHTALSLEDLQARLEDAERRLQRAHGLKEPTLIRASETEVEVWKRLIRAKAGAR